MLAAPRLLLIMQQTSGDRTVIINSFSRVDGKKIFAEGVGSVMSCQGLTFPLLSFNEMHLEEPNKALRSNPILLNFLMNCPMERKQIKKIGHFG